MKNSLFIKLSETPRSDVNDSNYKSKKIKIFTKPVNRDTFVLFLFSDRNR